jgi:hypothetical protein
LLILIVLSRSCKISEIINHKASKKDIEEIFLKLESLDLSCRQKEEVGKCKERFVRDGFLMDKDMFILIVFGIFDVL